MENETRIILRIANEAYQSLLLHCDFSTVATSYVTDVFVVYYNVRNNVCEYLPNEGK